MDTMRGQDEIEGEESLDFGAIEAPPQIAGNERRMHVRAYNYWVSLLGSRALPSIEDLNPEDMEDFSAHSVLLDFSMGLDNPAIIYLGSALREECGIIGPIERIDQVPPRSLLTRLTDHYLQIIANAAPVGFEAEFTNQRGAEIMYRGILMPFSSNDETIDFIYGVISWKEVASKQMSDALGEEMMNALGRTPTSYSTNPIWADGPSATADFEEEDEDSPLARMRQVDESDFGFDEIADEAPSAQPDILDLTERVVEEDTASRFYSDIPLGQPAEKAEAEERHKEEGEAVALEETEAFELLESLGSVEAAGPTDRTEAVAPAPEELDLAAFMAEIEDQQAPAEAGDEDLFRSEAVVTDEETSAESGEEQLSLEAFRAPEEAPLGIEPAVLSLIPREEEIPEAAPLVESDQSGKTLAALLDLARRGAAEASDTDLRSRTSLYRAISLAYDFALCTRDAPADYARMLEQAEITVQDRSPMTAVVKMVFGVQYEKTRIAEYALALDYAVTRELPRGSLAAQLSAYEGGLKGLVRDMREARRAEDFDPATRSLRRLDRALRRLHDADAADEAELPFNDEGLAVVVARREADGSISLVAGVGLDDKAAQKVVIAASKTV